MNALAISECSILWDKRKRVPKRVRHAIKKDLLGMSQLILEAMDFTKDKVLKGRETQVVYWLNTNIGEDWYKLEIWYENSQKGWHIAICDGKTPIAELVSNKYRLFQIILDENAEREYL